MSPFFADGVFAVGDFAAGSFAAGVFAVDVFSGRFSRRVISRWASLGLAFLRNVFRS